ncbi:MAG: hypothetical protein M0R51_11760 [Clostridia bacterium]|jgi:hypothetical protein|nr:hypothetical protein [Clostridia bacterium]
MEKEITINNVIDTYKCLISCLESFPGMSLEEAFSYDAIQSIKKEYEWLQKLKYKDVKIVEQYSQSDNEESISKNHANCMPIGIQSGLCSEPCCSILPINLTFIGSLNMRIEEPDEFEQAGIELTEKQKEYAYKLVSPNGKKDTRLLHNLIVLLSSKHKK